MSKFLIFLLGAVLGVVIGGALIFYFYGGAPRAAQLPGNPIQPPDPNGLPAGTASVVLNQQFFDTILATIFRDMNAPAFPLNLTGQNNFNAVAKPQFASFAFQNNGGCDGKITLKPEGSGVTTGVRLEDGKITAPLAFNGSTLVFGNCIEFAGWAQANLALRYDDAQKNVFGQINVETVNLDNVSPLVSGFVTPIVQTTINNRVNPITILRGQQLALNLPIAASDGTLKANVKDVRSDIKDGALNLFVTYDFAGAKGVQPSP
ncbi:MAG: hypothetical protein H0X49_00975 [Acidobacteria bacterium]|nr:hypothetical protein [Acidobacteriota bacterium]